jgi:hypothetical protein
LTTSATTFSVSTPLSDGRSLMRRATTIAATTGAAMMIPIITATLAA